jgi:hypothetical protein
VSDIAFLTAIERRLRDVFGDTEGQNVGIQDLGQPPPGAGQWYIGIDDAGYTNTDDGPESLDERYDLLVVVTFKLGYAPKDRQAREQLRTTQLRAKARQVVTSLHGDYTWFAYANGSEGITSSHSGFIEPLKLRSVSPAIPKPPEWVYAEDAENPPTVLAREIRLGGARRVQPLPGVLT